MKNASGFGGVYRWSAVWIFFCVWCQCVPWLLSSLGALNARGYWIASGISLAVVAVFRFSKRQLSLPKISKFHHRWLRQAKRQPVFAIWLFVLVAAIIGGALYPPTNHDGLTYRFPRVLHWFWEGHWHWIENPAEPQMNLSTHGMEWLTAFCFALTGSDRLFFLVNLVSFVLLPGLLFAFLIRVGVSKRVASWWMWLLPCGYGLALQAGSIGNDLFALPYALAGVVFALRARETRSVLDVVLAILAAALVTGTKLSNAPLVLPIAVALAFNLPWVFRWKNAPALFAATAAGLIASAAPVLIACQIYTGHFSGDPENSKSLNVQNPLAGVVANSLQVGARNLMPPVNPLAGFWNRNYRDWLSESLNAWLQQDYPRFHLNWDELPQEENDGIGLGIFLLAGISLVAAFASRRRTELARSSQTHWIAFAIVGATAFYLAKMGSEAAPRLMLPYYALLLGVLAAFQINGRLTRKRWWRVSATIAACFVLPALILSPNRPWFPSGPSSPICQCPCAKPQSPNAWKPSTKLTPFAMTPWGRCGIGCRNLRKEKTASA